MSKNYLHFAAVGILVFVLSGCAVNRVSLVDTHQVSVANQDTEKIEILWIDVYQNDGQIWACGVLRQRGLHPSAIRTHVDIQVLSEDGSVQSETISEDVYVPRSLPGKGPNWVRFHVKLAGDTPIGSKVGVKVHSGEHNSSDS